MTQPDTGGFERLLEELDLQQLDRDLFLGEPGDEEGHRLYGGLIAAQSLVAAGRTIAAETGALVHSVHCYFLRPGQFGKPVQHVVHRIRDGRTFTTRRVVAHQGGEAIFSLEASFSRPEAGASRHTPLPRVPGPAGLPPAEDDPRSDVVMPRWLSDPAMDVLACPKTPVVDGRTFRYRWLRMRGNLPESPLLQAAGLIYASDRGPVSLAREAFGIEGFGASASLDHNLWFHHPPRFDDWVLMEQWTDVAHGGRALIHGKMYHIDGTLLATVAQEALIRGPRETPAGEAP